MKTIQVQMLNNNISSYWWKEIIRHFAKPGDEFEIRCWNEEKEEIKIALAYGYIFKRDKFETSIKGIVSQAMLKDLLSMPEPNDKTIYNKMTIFFTINIKYKLCSEHYGTELYLYNVSNNDLEAFIKIMTPFWESFSINIF